MTYLVVVNDEEQYSTWPADEPLPGGWRDAGYRGTEDACLDHIEQAWTDLRPRSIRELLAAALAASAAEPAAEPQPAVPADPAAGAG